MGKLIQPILSINGTQPQQLIDDAMAVFRACRKAEQAFRDAAPHPRDYQSGSMTQYHNARAAWAQRVELLQDMQDDIIKWAETIQERSSK